MDYLVPCMIFVWVSYLWDTYLEWRQRRVYQTCKNVPSELVSILDQKKFDKSRVYQLDKSSYSLIHNFFKQMEFLVIIMVGGIPFTWAVAGSILKSLGLNEEYEVSQSVVFSLLVKIYFIVVKSPWTIYAIFVLEERHGFNKQTWEFFVKDQIKRLLISSVLTSVVISGLVTIIKWGGQYFYIYAWLFILAYCLAMEFIYHDYIAPCLDKFRPLPEGDVRVAIEKLALSLKFPLKKLLVVEGSKRSAHSNAYFYGFWKNKYIVLFDTLFKEGIMDPIKPKEEEGQKNKDSGEEPENGVKEDASDYENTLEKEVEDDKKEDKVKGCTTPEILGVVAHELGHWKLSHNLKAFIIFQVHFLLLLFLFGYFVNQQDMYSSFGFPDSAPILIGLILFLQLVFIPYNEIVSFLLTQLDRRLEYQADAFALSLGHAESLSSALVTLYQDNLGFPVADPLYSAFHHSHPTLLERLQALKTKTD